MEAIIVVSIPFIAGQWSLQQARREVAARAVSQSPSLRGSGRFWGELRRAAEGRRVSIPFIAGQWSLQKWTFRFRWTFHFRLNPLHCGAVVASHSWWTSEESATLCLNPLHCGAVVASGRRRHAPSCMLLVSIPFIAGQWSLPTQARRIARDLRVSIPFIAGQWSLPACRAGGAWRCTGGLNPLHCGAVVASRDHAARGARAVILSQSPSLRGSGRFMDAFRREWDEIAAVSIPFIAGQWSLPAMLNPEILSGLSSRVSIPFIAGQWSLQQWLSNLAPVRRKSQSPSLRGSGRFPARP